MNPILIITCLLLATGTIAPTSTRAQNLLRPTNQDEYILFRTKNYVAQIVWRQGIPFMTVSNNGWRVLADARAEVLPARGSADRWTTYIARSGDYSAYVRLSPAGQAAIEISLAGRQVTEEYATLPGAKSRASANLISPNETALMFETDEYAVRVFRQARKLMMNLYNKQTDTTELRQVPVTLVKTSNITIYRHDGTSTIQAREDNQGRRSLLIIRDNAIQYRGEAIF